VEATREVICAIDSTACQATMMMVPMALCVDCCHCLDCVVFAALRAAGGPEAPRRQADCAVPAWIKYQRVHQESAMYITVL
jgi:hypothetical protein